MANTETFQVDYKTDFGGEYAKFKFKVERGLMDRTGLSFDAPDNTRKASCGTAKYFQMRKAVVKFEDGKSIEVPIAELDIVSSVLGSLLTAAGVACVTLKGERWKFVPPGILGGNYAGDGIDSPLDKPLENSLSYNYTLDGGGSLILNTSAELSPQEIYDSQISCLNVTTDQAIKCSGSSGIKPRRFIGERANNTTGGTIRRQVIVGSAVESVIKQCGASQMPTWNCFSYVGQSIPNAGDYYASTTP